MRLPMNPVPYMPATRALAGAAVLVLLGSFFALPLYAALTLCTMPCCEHETPANGAVASTAPSPCETECGVSAAEAPAGPATAVAPVQRAEQRVELVMSADIAFARSSLTAADHRLNAAGYRSADAPLNLLHSVFRI